MGKFEKGNKLGGRPPGIPNKITQSVRQIYTEVFDKLGGTPAMVEWAQKSDENRREFYRMHAKMIPQDIQAKVESGSLHVVIKTTEDKGNGNGGNGNGHG